VKKTIIVLSAAALVSVASAVLAQGTPGKTPGVQHPVSGKHHPGAFRLASKNHPAASGYAPGAPSGLASAPGSVDKDLEASRQAAGDGGGM
jgi:hypothetical protein